MLREVLLVILNLNIFVHGIAPDSVVEWNITSLQYASSEFDIAKPAVAILNKPLKIILTNYYTSEITDNIYNTQHNILAASDNGEAKMLLHLKSSIKHRLSLLCVPVTFHQHVVYVINHLTNFTIVCGDNNTNEIFSTSKRNDTSWTTVIKIEKAREEMNTLWRCAMKNYDSKSQNITFKVRVKGLKMVKMSVGRSELHWQMTTSSALDYDGITRYSYINGEVVDLVCRSDKSKGHLRLRYYNAEGKLLIETDLIAPNDTAEFRKIMTFEHNGAKIDCIYISEYKLEYTYRLIFRHKTASDHYKIKINGLKLVSTEPENPESVEEHYLYKFYKGQKISVSCAMNKRFLTSNLSLYFHNPTMNAIRPVTKQWKRIITLNTDIIDKLNHTHLKCSNGETPVIADILFLSETIDPFILALSASDIVHQYRKNSSTWVIDYHYTVNQTLECLGEDHSWTFKSTHLPSGPVTLRDEYNGSSIICETYKKPIIRRTVVNLFRKLETNSGAGKLSTDPDYSNIWMIGCAVFVSAMAIVLLSVIIWCRLSRNKATRENSCTNLTLDFETQIPRYPNQWDDTSTRLQECTMVNNQLYTAENLPIQIKRKKSDDHVYHYPVALSNDSITGTTKLDDNNTRGLGEAYSNVSTNSSAGEDKSQLSTDNKTYADIFDSILRIKRTSEYVEPAYSVVHLTD